VNREIAVKLSIATKDKARSLSTVSVVQNRLLYATPSLSSPRQERWQGFEGVMYMLAMTLGRLHDPLTSHKRPSYHLPE
jgi:hypothetical protein